MGCSLPAVSLIGASFMRFRFAPPLLLALALLPACRDAKVTSYRTAHEDPEPLPPILADGAAAQPAGSGLATAPRPGMANTAVPTAAGDGLVWTAPAHWQAKPASAMRKGSYAISGDGGATADLSITAFPGDVGGELANINRWRSQLDLPPLGAADLPAVTTRSAHDGLEFTVVDFVSAQPDQPKRTLGASVPFEGATWFFKLMGPDALVAREKPAFLEFLKTVKPSHTHAP